MVLRKIILIPLFCCVVSAAKAQESAAPLPHIEEWPQITAPVSAPSKVIETEGPSGTPGGSGVKTGLIPAMPSFLVPSKLMKAKPKFSGRSPLDTGWWTRLHIMAEVYDGVTTKLVIPKYADEGDPISRAFIGTNASPWRMVVFGALEVGSVSAIPNRKLRKLTQVALIGTHLFLASRNLRDYLRWK